MKLDWSVPGVPEDTREVMNWGLRKAMEQLDAARNAEAMSGPSAEPLVVLAQIKAAQGYLDDVQKWAVAELRATGRPWSEIGEALGTTRQAAQMRFGKVHTRDADLRACCDHPAHEPGRCEFFTAPRTDFPGSIEQCDCDGNSPTTRD